MSWPGNSLKTEVIKLLCTLESPAGLVKMQIAGSPPPEFLIQEFWWGTEQEEFVFLNNTQVIMMLLVWGGDTLRTAVPKLSVQGKISRCRLLCTVQLLLPQTPAYSNGHKFMENGLKDMHRCSQCFLLSGSSSSPLMPYFCIISFYVIIILLYYYMEDILTLLPVLKEKL